MKILFVTPYLPSSLRIRPLRLIQYLSQKHEITLVSLLQPAWTARFVEDLKPYCKQIYPINLDRYKCIANSLLALPSTRPMSVAYFSSGRMKSLVQNLVQTSNFDLIHTEFIRAAPFTAKINGIPKIYDSVDSIAFAYERGWRNQYSQLSNRIISFEEWFKMRRYEPKMVRSFNRVIVSSPIDQKYLSFPAGPEIDVLPNGVNQEYFHWDEQERDENSIVFVGQMNYYVNVDSVLHFYNTAFKLIQQQRPNVRFSIVGADPRKSIRELAKDPAVEVTGYVPDIRPYITRASVFVCPMLCGSGIQNKLLHAMSMGTPVVTTSLAIQSLQVKDGEHLLVADDPQKFADSVVALIKDKNFGKRLSANGRKYIRENHDWGVIGRRLESIYDQVVNGQM